MPKDKEAQFFDEKIRDNDVICEKLCTMFIQDTAIIS